MTNDLRWLPKYCLIAVAMFKNGDKAKVRLRGEDIPLDNPWDQLLWILGISFVDRHVATMSAPSDDRPSLIYSYRASGQESRHSLFLKVQTFCRHPWLYGTAKIMTWSTRAQVITYYSNNDFQWPKYNIILKVTRNPQWFTRDRH